MVSRKKYESRSICEVLAGIFDVVIELSMADEGS